jgi:hypothetical protein
MSRTLTVSTPVYAAIWAKRQEGEETEDDILRRVLGCGPVPATPAATGARQMPLGAIGVRDERNGISFAEGFEIFRSYKHQEYRAKADAGSWLRLDNGQRYPTLNQLNSSIVAGAENVWNGIWKFRAADGKQKSIDELRRA